MMNRVEEAKEATQVQASDPRNFQNLNEYCALAIPSVFYVTLEWWLYDIMTVIAGLISINDQWC